MKYLQRALSERGDALAEKVQNQEKNLYSRVNPSKIIANYLLETVANLYEKNGQIPELWEINSNSALPSRDIVVRFLGPRDTWEEKIEKYLASKKPEKAIESTELPETAKTTEPSEEIKITKKESVDIVEATLSPKEGDVPTDQKAKTITTSEYALDSHVSINISQGRVELCIEKILKPIMLDIRF